MQITIGGVPGAGKSTVARLVAEKLGYKFYSMGAIRREIAESRGLTIDEFNSLPENTDEVVDEYQKELGKIGDNFVNEGRLAFHFMPESVKIYFRCEAEVSAERIFNDPRSSERKYSSKEDVLADVRERMQNDTERYSKHYGVDCYNHGHFNHVIDTSRLSIPEVVEKVISIIDSKRF
ncbi:MAG: (d)CMP kinase [Nanoarchaeota archaeon]|nr:(d)CMP kinase [Nanoarchaeota archaeon]